MLSSRLAHPAPSTRQIWTLYHLYGYNWHLLLDPPTSTAASTTPNHSHHLMDGFRSPKRLVRRRPIRACQRCRARRVQCDRAEPTCGNCVRSDVPCVYASLSGSLSSTGAGTAAVGEPVVHHGPHIPPLPPSTEHRHQHQHLHRPATPLSAPVAQHPSSGNHSPASGGSNRRRLRELEDTVARLTREVRGWKDRTAKAPPSATAIEPTGRDLVDAIIPDEVVVRGLVQVYFETVHTTVTAIHRPEFADRLAMYYRQKASTRQTERQHQYREEREEGGMMTQSRQQHQHQQQNQHQQYLGPPIPQVMGMNSYEEALTMMEASRLRVYNFEDVEQHTATVYAVGTEPMHSNDPTHPILAPPSSTATTTSTSMSGFFLGTCSVRDGDHVAADPRADIGAEDNSTMSNVPAFESLLRAILYAAAIGLRRTTAPTASHDPEELQNLLRLTEALSALPGPAVLESLCPLCRPTETTSLVLQSTLEPLQAAVIVLSVVAAQGSGGETVFVALGALTRALRTVQWQRKPKREYEAEILRRIFAQVDFLDVHAVLALGGGADKSLVGGCLLIDDTRRIPLPHDWDEDELEHLRSASHLNRDAEMGETGDDDGDGEPSTDDDDIASAQPNVSLRLTSMTVSLMRYCWARVFRSILLHYQRQPHANPAHLHRRITLLAAWTERQAGSIARSFTTTGDGRAGEHHSQQQFLATILVLQARTLPGRAAFLAKLLGLAQAKPRLATRRRGEDDEDREDESEARQGRPDPVVLGLGRTIDGHVGKHVVGPADVDLRLFEAAVGQVQREARALTAGAGSGSILPWPTLPSSSPIPAARTGDHWLHQTLAFEPAPIFVLRVLASSSVAARGLLPWMLRAWAWRAVDALFPPPAAGTTGSPSPSLADDDAGLWGLLARARHARKEYDVTGGSAGGVTGSPFVPRDRARIGQSVLDGAMMRGMRVDVGGGAAMDIQGSAFEQQRRPQNGQLTRAFPPVLSPMLWPAFTG